MPWFTDDSVRGLVGELASGEQTLDLRGISLERAQLAVRHLLEQQHSQPLDSVVIRIDPATQTSGETLFLPLGRQLLEARKRGLISRMHPLPEADGGGFYVELSRRQEQQDTPS